MGRLILHTYTAILILMLSGIGNAQDNLNKPALLQELPSEKLILKINNSFILSGETLYYDLYCLNSNTFSRISKIGYVELVQADKKVIFKHKLNLKKGRSAGDFFLPSELKTGHYKLIAYTHWSLNNIEDAYVQHDLYIINPFLNASDNNLIKTFEATEPHIEISKINKTLQPEQKNINPRIALITNNEVYAKRHKVTLQIKNNGGAINYGSYTLSVKKRDAIFATFHTNDSLIQSTTVTEPHLPDLRGELISGKVVLVNGNKPIENTTVSLSIPGDDLIFITATTNKDGKFYFNMTENFYNKAGYLQLALEANEKFKIVLDTIAFEAYDELNFYPLKIDKSIASWIEKRSINNQIESAYYNLKQDSIIEQPSQLPFYGKPDLVYVLDDYTRFKSVRETFVEVVQQAAIRNDGEGYEFLVYEDEIIDTRLFDNVKPLLLFNGVRILDETFVVEYDPREIESISVVMGTYVDGSKFYNGIIDIRLKTSSNYEFNDIYAFKINLEPLISPKNYFRQTEESINKYIPDFRTLLLWMPKLAIDSSLKEVEFYTSSVTGFYEVKLEGFTEDGKKVYLKRVFEVK